MCRAKSVSVPQVTMPARKRSTADIKELNCSMYVNLEGRHETYVCIHDIVEALISVYILYYIASQLKSSRAEFVNTLLSFRMYEILKSFSFTARKSNKKKKN